MTDALSREMMYGRGADLRIFISSKMNETLNAERLIAAKVIQSMIGHRPWLWETDAAAGAAKSDDECVDIASTSDGLVLLLAVELSDITEREYRAAKRNGAQRYVMIKTPPDALDDRAKAFVEQERSTNVTRNFASDKELRSHLRISLQASMVKASRESVIARRKVEMGPTPSIAGGNDGD
jgi:hypothetical protein